MRVQQDTEVVVLTDPFDDDASTPVVTAVRVSDGEALDPVPAVSITADNRAQVTLTTTHTAELDRLLITVAAQVDGAQHKVSVDVDVVGAHFATLAALRLEPNLDDTTRFPDWMLAEARDAWESHVETAARVAFVPQLGVESRLSAPSLVLRQNRVRALRLVEVDDVDVTSQFGLYPGDHLVRVGGFGGTSMRIVYEHGYDAPPLALAREVRRAIRSDLLGRGAQAPADRLWEQTADGLTVRYATPAWADRQFTGIMSLDAMIEAHAWPRIGIA